MAKLPTYSEYKHTGIDWIGDVPAHWLLRPCRSVVEHIVQKNHDGAVQYYLSLMANVGVIPYEDKGDIGNKKPDDLRKCKLVKKGQLVINSMNYAIGSYGMSDYDGVCSSVYIILEPQIGKIHKRYALRVFENSPFQKHLATFGNGILAHRAAIGWDDIKGQYIPIPTMEEQENILSFLDHETAKVDSLIEKQQQLIKLLKEKRQAVIYNAVTRGVDDRANLICSDIPRIGRYPEHWEIVMLGKKIQLQRGVDITKEQQGKGEVPVVSSGGIASYHDEAICEGPGVVVGRKGTIGKLHYVESDFWAHDTTLYVKKFNGNLVRFVYYKLMSMKLEDYDTGSSNPTLNRNIVHPEKVSWPPVHEQEHIIKYLDDFCELENRAIDKVQHAITLLKQRRVSLISAAVTGKIDVRNWQAPTAQKVHQQEAG